MCGASRSGFEPLAFRVAKHKRNKAMFWCVTCQMRGFRNPHDAEAKAKEVGGRLIECPSGWGWHVR